MKNRSDMQSRSDLSMVAATLLVALTTGCSGADAGVESTTAGDEAPVESLELGLHAFPGVPLLPWRGRPPEANQQNSNQPGLNVAYRLSIGVVDFNLFKLVVGLQVCWYTPSNPNNTYTSGDPFGCTTIGSQQAGSWTTQQCGANEVVSGYRVGLYEDDDGDVAIGKFATRCRSLTNPSVTRTFGFVGDGNVLFADTLDCTSHLGQTAYLEYFSSNSSFSGFNGSCVLP
jgi:hypothetical protein